jgi:DNA-binding protein YbaB
MALTLLPTKLSSMHFDGKQMGEMVSVNFTGESSVRIAMSFACSNK